MEAGSFTPVFCLPASLLGKDPPVKLDSGQRPFHQLVDFLFSPLLLADELTSTLKHLHTRGSALQCSELQCTANLNRGGALPDHTHCTTGQGPAFF